MDKPMGRVLKAEDVKIEGKFHLDIGQPSNRPAASAGAGNAVSSSPQASIVEHHADFAVIEVTCGCGAKTRVRCEYRDTKTN